MKNTMLVAGGNGFVGSNLSILAQKRGYRVVIADSVKTDFFEDIQQVCFDIKNEAEVQKYVDEIRPYAIVNTAAISDIDKAEKNKDLAYSVNVTGALNLARAAKRHNSKYIFISTDAVFDGKHPPFSESSELNPVNYYGETKVLAEADVKNEYPPSAIVRLSLVLGTSITPCNSFIMGFIEKLKKGNPIPTPSNEIRTPIDVYTLTESLLELIEKDFQGAIHLGSTESGSKNQVSKTIALKLGYDPEIIVEADLVNPDRAPRHHLGILDVTKAKKMLRTNMLGFEETINRSLSKFLKS